MSVAKHPTRRTWGLVVDVPTLDGKRRQIRRRGFATKREAVAAERTLLDELAAGNTAPAALTLRRYLLDRWLPAVEADERLKPSTKSSYRLGARHLAEQIGDVPLGDLTAEHLDLAQRRLAHYSTSLRRQTHVVASKSLRQAQRWRLIASSPALDATPPPVATVTPVAWTPAEASTFLREASSDRWAPLFRLLVATGMRRGEAVGLTWSQVDLEQATALVDRAAVVVDGGVHTSTTKTGRARPVSLDPETVTQLRAWRQQQAEEMLALGQYRPDTDAVWTWPDGSTVHPGIITKTFARIAARAGLPTLRLHGLRHTHANAALDAGVELVDLSKRLGHSSIAVTANVYTPASTSRDRAAAVAVADLFASS